MLVSVLSASSYSDEEKETSPKENSDRRSHGCSKRIVRADHKLSLHKGMKIAARVGTAIPELSHLVSPKSDFFNIAKAILLARVTKVNKRLHGEDLCVYPIAFQIESVNDIQGGQSDAHRIPPMDIDNGGIVCILTSPDIESLGFGPVSLRNQQHRDCCRDDNNKDRKYDMQCS